MAVTFDTRWFEMELSILETEAKRLPRVLLADDDGSMLKAIEVYLQYCQTQRFEVIGTVKDGIELLKATTELAPDVAVVDIIMPELNGVDAIARLKTMHCDTKVVILTMHREPEFVRAAFAAGAAGYVLKHRLVKDLPGAIELALRGERFLSPPLLDPAA